MVEPRKMDDSDKSEESEKVVELKRQLSQLREENKKLDVAKKVLDFEKANLKTEAETDREKITFRDELVASNKEKEDKQLKEFERRIKETKDDLESKNNQLKTENKMLKETLDEQSKKMSKIQVQLQKANDTEENYVLIERTGEIMDGYRNKIAKHSAEMSDRLKGDTELSELERLRRIAAVQKTALDRFEHTAQDLIDRLQEAINIMKAGLEHIKPPDHLGECEL